MKKVNKTFETQEIIFVLEKIYFQKSKELEISSLRSFDNIIDEELRKELIYQNILKKSRLLNEMEVLKEAIKMIDKE